MSARDRKTALFQAIIKEYIKTAKPVGSELLVEKCHIKCSPATVRNYMADLENEGLIAQPHTSAGRIPTAKGYQYFLDNFFTKQAGLSPKCIEAISKLLAKEKEPEQAVKDLGKGIAEIAQEAVVISLQENSFYYTGISHLFQKPEFKNIETIYHLSEIIDHFDEVMAGLHKKNWLEPQILIGNANPFHSDCSLIMTSYKFKHGLSGVFGILGPLRMNYELNYSLIEYLNKFNANE